MEEQSDVCQLLAWTVSQMSQLSCVPRVRLEANQNPYQPQPVALRRGVPAVHARVLSTDWRHFATHAICNAVSRGRLCVWRLQPGLWAAALVAAGLRSGDMRGELGGVWRGVCAERDWRESEHESE